MFSLIKDIVLHTVEIVEMQPESIKAKEKTEEVVEKVLPAQVTNSYGYLAN